jgi:hypothetical protein
MFDKLLGRGTNKPTWPKHIVEDLPSIRQNLSYPFRWRTIFPLLLGLTVILFIVPVVLSLTLGDTPLAPLINVFIWISVGISILGWTAAIYQYRKSLVFTAVANPGTANQQLQTIQQFFATRGIMVLAHPETENIQYVVSKPVKEGSQEREVVILIADNNRILINSHFSGKGLNLALNQRTYQGLVTAMEEFIAKKG